MLAKHSRITATVEQRTSIDLAEAALGDAPRGDLVALAGHVAADDRSLIEERHPYASEDLSRRYLSGSAPPGAC
jgi:hypothetical protein